MADEVIIGNVGGQDGVASEATLQALVRAVERMGGQRGQKGAGSKVQDLHNKALQSGTKATNDQTENIKENTGAVKNSTAAAQNFGRSLGNMAARGIGQVVASLSGMTRSLLAGDESMQAYASQIPVFGSALGAIAGYLDRSLDAFREMSAVGAGFNGDILAMRRAAAENNLTLDEFKNIVTRNSEVFGNLGGSVTAGIQRFTAMNRTLKETGDFEALKAMGFSIMEINQGMSDYITLQTRLGRIENRTTQDLAAGSAQYLKELDLLSRLTGKSRKELADQQARNAQDAAIRALTNQFAEGTEQFKNLQMSLQLIDTLPREVADGLKDMLDGIPQGPEAAALMNAAGSFGPQLAEAMRQIGQGADPQILIDAMKRAGGEFEKFAGMEGTQRAAYIRALRESNPTLASILDSATAMTALGRRNIAAEKAKQEEEAKAAAEREKVTAKLTNFQDAIRKMSEAIQIAFIDSGLIELFATGVEMFAKLITGAAETIKAFTARFKEDPLGAVVGLIKDSIIGLFSNVTVVGALVAGITALFLGKAALGAMSSAMSGWASRSVGRMFGGAGAAAGAGGGAGALAQNVQPSQAGKGFGSAISNISKGLGEGISAVLQGLATGISAFANPKVMLGAVGLAGAIVVIGAAVAGATWMIGKALPTFAEGLKGFADIDGGNLLKVAGGVAALGAAMAAMGAGQLVGAVTGALGGLAEGVASFFGVRPPLEKLKEFGDMNIDADRVKSNAQAVVEYGKAMAALGAGGAVGSIGNVAAAAADGLVKFFGGEVRLPWARIKEFESESFDTPKIKSNSEAIVAFSEAMSKIPVVPRERVGGLIGSVADFFLGAQQTPWAQVVAFGQLQLPSDRIKTNAEALAAFGEAMSKMPSSMPTGRTGGLIESITSFFGGERRMPWNELVSFGQLQLPTAQITSNAEALAAFGNALSAFRGTGTGGPINIPPGIAESLGRLSAIGSGDGLQRTAAGLQAIANVQNLQTTLGSLNALDATKLTSYNAALRDLTRVLADLNKELSNENRGGLFGGGNARANAGELLRNISVNTNAGAGNTGQLNEIMMRIFEVLTETKSLSEKIERNTKGSGANIASGDVSALR